MNTPIGTGVYLGRVVREWTQKEGSAHAKRALTAKLSHVALCAEAVDGWIAPLPALLEAKKTYSEIAGVHVSVYSLPSRARAMNPVAVSSTLLTAGGAVDAASLILDAEGAYRGLLAQLSNTLRLIRSGLRPGQSLGATNFGVPSDQSKYPWSALALADWFGWQEYETAGVRAKARAGLDACRKLMGGTARVIPHIASYERKGVTTPAEGLDGALRLAGDFNRSCIDDLGRVDVPGVWIWSDASLDDAECRTLHQIAEKAGW